LLARRGLFERLTTGCQAGVTLISAPPGSGKTVLLRSWIDDSGLAGRTAWVTVDRNERDPQRFWLSVVDKLRGLIGADAFVERLAPSPDFDGDAVVDHLVAALALLEEPVVLVIDDLHELSSRAASAQLEVLLARRPPPLRVMLATRRDPQLGLHRLRLAGDLVDIRDPDLRFTLEEARELLRAGGIELSEASSARLHARTEGWAAGLRLAALSLAGHPDPERFVAEFSGSERTVAEYLLAEVLERQPDEVRRMLLRTSFLDRVNGPLADLLGGGHDSEGILDRLEQQNAFVVALDADRTWFRYHQLFADLLRLELRRTDQSAVPALHRAAAQWYGRHGYVVEAVRHAQAGEDWQEAIRLLAEHAFSLALNGQEATVHSLLAVFPSELSSDPELAMLLALREMTAGTVEDCLAYLALAERNGQAVPPERRPRFELTLSVTRLGLARRRGDFDRTLGEVRRLGKWQGSGRGGEVTLNKDSRSVALSELGIVELWAGRFEEAERHLQEGAELARRISRPYLEMSCLAHLAVVAARRSYDETRALSRRAMAIAEAQGWAGTLVDCVPLAALGIADVVQGRFEEAQHWLDRAERALRPDIQPAAALLVHLALGMLHLALGRPGRALITLAEADRLQAILVTPHVLTVQTRWFLVQAQLKLGDAEAARATLAGLSEGEREWGEVSVGTAALQLAEGDVRGAISSLAPVVAGAAPVLRELSVIDALLLDALAHDRLGERQAVESDIEQALDLAEPEAVIFPFVTVPVRELLERHPRHRTAHAGLLSVILDVLAGSLPPVSPGQVPELAEDLSASELRVLRFLPSNLSAPEIASELYLSTSTIKTHMRHIYTKLGVHHRTEAVERARQLGLLGPSSRLRR
jgi:LuxR family maltose regulon positive regulatory protein